MFLVDTHCHLYSEEFETDIQTVIGNALSVGVQHFYLPGIDSSSIHNMLELEKKFPENCFAMMGLHPCYVKENYEQELAIVKEWLHKRNFIAVGEIGLDFYWDKTFATQQLFCFEQQMQWALEKQMPIVIHSRESMQATINAVKPFAKEGLKGVFHCFTGSYESAKEIIDMGFLLGIGGVITYKNAGLGQVVEKLGIDKIILETDAPYLTPVPYRGKRNEPAYLAYVINKIAEVTNLPANEITVKTTQNALNLFDIQKIIIK
jgi:TatD DNase family protein